MSIPERRAVIIVVVGLAANAALDVGGYEARWLANVLWVVVLLGVGYLFWPDLPARVWDRWRGDRRWTAQKPIWDPRGPEHALLLRLEPPEGEPIDPAIQCRVEVPGGAVHTLDVRPPGMVAVEGTPNSYYYAVFPSASTGGRPPLERGSYRITWRSASGVPGWHLLRVRRFTVDDHGRLR